MYRMALDQIPQTSRHLRFQIMKNIGIAFTKTGDYQQALQNFQSVMEGAPDPQTGFNLLLCFLCLDDPDRMKRGFIRLLASKPVHSAISGAGGGTGPSGELLDEDGDADEDEEHVDDHEDDALKDYVKEKWE